MSQHMGSPAAATAPRPAPRDTVLRADSVSVEYDGPQVARAVRDVSFDLRRGEVLGIAGESGCGKSTLARAVLRLIRSPGRVTSGSLLFTPEDDGGAIDVMALSGRELRRFQWAQMSMVFQGAMNALNPVTSVQRQFDDIFKAHRPGMKPEERRARVGDLLEMVGIDRARARSFPHELSGGMRQRVMIAMALALDPKVVVFDEPTTALDVVVQREILDEIERLRSELGFSVIFITHDLSLLLEVTDRMAVMYAGEIVESGPSEEVGTRPAHPYTLGLLKSFPELLGERRELRGIPGSPPSLTERIDGCAFAARCPFAFGPCTSIRPRLSAPDEAGGAEAAGASTVSRAVACHLHNRELRPEGPPAELVAAQPGPAAPAAPASPAAKEES
jgi:peptide/nickel transport system ATP-binding protein